MKKLLILLALVMPVSAQGSDLSEERVKELVLEAIRENPGIVMEAVELLRRKEQESKAEEVSVVLERNREALENDPNAPVLGNPDGDVTVVEFFDYNCPYCRKAKPEIEALLERDPDVRLVYREWPILGEGSVFAARAALASRRQGKYEEFHWALMGMEGRAERASVLRVAGQVGLDTDRLLGDMNSPEIEAHIAASKRLTHELGLSGTPSFVIGSALVPGVIDADQMTRLVENARNQPEK